MHHRPVLAPDGALEPVGPVAEFIGRPAHWQAHAHLLHSVLTGENAFQHVHGVDVWTYRATHPEEGAIFDRATSANSRRQTHAVLAAYDFGRFGCVVDVGGGQGAFLAALLAQHGGLRGVLFDQPWVVSRAGPILCWMSIAFATPVASAVNVTRQQVVASAKITPWDQVR